MRRIFLNNSLINFLSLYKEYKFCAGFSSFAKCFNIEQCKKLDAHELELRKTLEHEKAVKKGDADAVRAQIAKEVDIERQKLLAQSNDQLTYDLRRENDALKAEIESLKRELEELSKKMLKDNVEALIQKASDDGDIPF